jgi:hypothetical protein
MQGKNISSCSIHAMMDETIFFQCLTGWTGDFCQTNGTSEVQQPSDDDEMDMALIAGISAGVGALVLCLVIAVIVLWVTRK